MAPARVREHRAESPARGSKVGRLPLFQAVENEELERQLPSQPLNDGPLAPDARRERHGRRSRARGPAR